VSELQTARPFRLDGKVALITGAASGIGNAIARQFAASGATVRILDRDERAASEAVQRITEEGGSATSHACDVTNQRQVQDVFHAVVGQAPLNILVNNAGVSHIGTVESTS